MNDRIEEICNNATFGNGQQNGLQVEGGSYNATAFRIGHANHNKVVEPPSWWSNPYLEPNGSGWFKQPSVPAVVWWLQHPIMGLSHVRYNVVDNVIEVELATWDERPHSWSDADASFLLCRLQELTRGLVKNRADLLDALVVVARQREYSKGSGGKGQDHGRDLLFVEVQEVRHELQNAPSAALQQCGQEIHGVLYTEGVKKSDLR